MGDAPLFGAKERRNRAGSINGQKGEVYLGAWGREKTQYKVRLSGLSTSCLCMFSFTLMQCFLESLAIASWHPPYIQ
jgi:hypothetical protein